MKEEIMEMEIETIDSIEDYSDIGLKIVLGETTKTIADIKLGEYYIVKTSDFLSTRTENQGDRISKRSLLYKDIKNSQYLLLYFYSVDNNYLKAHIYTIGSIGNFGKLCPSNVELYKNYDSNLPLYEISKENAKIIVDDINKCAIAVKNKVKDTVVQYDRYIELFDDTYQKYYEMIKVSCDLFYEDLWSFDRISTLNSNKAELLEINAAKYVLTIKFPEIHIKNRDYDSTKKSHEIKDLYTFAYFDKNMRLLGGIYGRRMSITAAEFKSGIYGYAHSHLPRNTSANQLPFCLGHYGNPIKNAVDNMCCDQLTPALIEDYCLHLSFVYYESLEGTPHCRFSSVIPVNKTVYDIGDDILNDETNKVIGSIAVNIPFILSNDILSPITVDKVNVEFNKYLDSISTPELTCIVDNNIGYRMSRTKVGISNIRDVISNYQPIWFKGELIHSKLEDEDETVMVEGMLPKAKKEIYRKLSETANNIILNKNYYESRNR